MAERIFKYHGLGNDFVILDRRESGADIDAAAVVFLCDRRRGVGGDGVLALLPSAKGAARMVVHNADGSIAEMCGNGIRCAAKYLVDSSGQRSPSIDLDTGAGLLRCKVDYEGNKASSVEVSMGPARLVADNLPSGKLGRPFVDQELPDFPGVKGTAVSMGNPHLVLFGRGLEEAATLGPKLERAAGFPERTNVELVRVHGGELEVVVWERGSGLTQACGTGACAAVAAAVQERRLSGNRWTLVKLPGGRLRIKVASDLSEVLLSGPATFVFEAEYPPQPA
jgi:diaminopimelate epimerase